MHPASYWLKRLEDSQIPWGPIFSPEDILEHSYVNERGLVASIEDNQQSQFRTLGSPLKLSLCPVSYRLPPPGFGEHTLQILESLDYSAAEIDRLFEHKVVHQSKMTRGKP